jgi:hypothetical protein
LTGKSAFASLAAMRRHDISGMEAMDRIIARHA